MRCPGCGYANDVASAFCAACYRDLAPKAAPAAQALPPAARGVPVQVVPSPAGVLPAGHVPAAYGPLASAPPPAPVAASAPQPVAGAPAQAERLPGVVWALALVGAAAVLLFCATLLDQSLSSLRTVQDGATLRSDASPLLMLGALLGLGAAGLGVLLAGQPRGGLHLAVGAPVGVLVGALVAFSFAEAARRLARTPLHDGVVVADATTLAGGAALALVAGGAVVLAVRRDRAAAFLAFGFVASLAFAVALVGSGLWLSDEAARLVATAQARPRTTTYHYVPLPGIVLALGAVALAALALRRRRA